MITLATFGPMLDLPDASPFVTKTELLLKMSGLPYRKIRGDVRRAPKGKLPYIEDDGEVVADSTFIRLHLERKYDIDFDAGLTRVQRGTAWAVEKMLEDHLYWILINERWLNDGNFDKGPAMFFAGLPAPIRPIIKHAVRRSLRKSVQLQGIGRHDAAAIDELGLRCLCAVADVMGENEYLTGEQIAGADATVHAFLLSTLCSHFDSPMRERAHSFPNLTAYCERMTQRFFTADPARPDSVAPTHFAGQQQRH